MIFLDSHSTTKIDQMIFNEMYPYFMEHFGNPASSHIMGECARDAIELAKQRIANVINTNKNNIYFTSSATEANNIVIKGINRKNKFIFITTNIEHSSVSAPLKTLEKNSRTHTRFIKVNQDGNIDYDKLEWTISCLKNHIVLVTIMTANNEIGTINDIKRIGNICKKYNVLFHTDATQAIGKIDIDVEEMNIFALTMSGHKIYGPKGVGALYVRDASKLTPLIDGGYQNILSSGTQNVPAIVGMGLACAVAQSQQTFVMSGAKIHRDNLLKLLKKEIPDLIINGTMENRLPNNLNVSIPDVSAEILIKEIEDVIISGGSACSAGIVNVSPIIEALGNPYPECAIRFGIGKYITSKEIKIAAEKIIKIVKRIRG